ncbi:MAG TPA: ABC transporter substrate-binding protein [Kofleriaceae bacterium]|jgi:peptide/nickel transport system substrate-binding protein|nr:ABC transporter substrate-binding protein [Kofleriaceae bacterium]
MPAPREVHPGHPRHPRRTLCAPAARRLLHAVALVGCAVGLANAETRPRYGGTVEASLLGAPVGFDPITAQAHADLTVIGLVFDTLYITGPDGTVQPHLALGMPVFDAAHTAAHVALRRGVVFHDSVPLAPSDVVDSLERVRSKAAWVLAPVTSVRISGEGLDLTLRAPVADLAALLALPQTAITKRGQPPGPTHPIGTGPFVVERFDPSGRQLVLRAFDQHFAGRPYLDRLVLGWFDTPDGEARRFETGAAQLSARGEAAFAGARPKYLASEVESPAALLLFVGFGKRHPAITDNRELRIALDLALDRGALSTITTGERTLPTRSPLPIEAGAPGLDAAGRAGDADRARATLAEAAKRAPALAPPSLAGSPLAIIFDETRPDDREIALRVSRGLDKLGIGFTIEAVAADKLRDRAARGDCDLWIGQLAAPLTFPAAWWGAAFAAGGDDWARVQLAAGALDSAAAGTEFARRLPIVPLMFRSLLVWHRAEVHGLAFDASGRPGLADLYWFKGRP